MVLRFLESFDHYGPTGTINDLLQRKWHVASPSSEAALTVVEGKSDGSFAMQTADNSFAGCVHIFEQNNQPSTLIVGFWLMHDGINVNTGEFLQLGAANTTQFHIGLEFLTSANLFGGQKQTNERL